MKSNKIASVWPSGRYQLVKKKHTSSEESFPLAYNEADNNAYAYVHVTCAARCTLSV